MKIVHVDDLICKIGESAQENWDLVDSARKHHWFFHLTDFPSPYVVLECDRQEPNAHIKERCAELCVEYSKHRNNKKIKVDSTSCGNVKIDKKDEVGECDYKNESKVEVILIKGGKKAENQDDERGSQCNEKDTKGKGRAKGGGYDAKKTSDKAGMPAAPLVGVHAQIRKAGAGGWATITFKEASVRDSILRNAGEIFVQGGIQVKLQPQVDQKTKEEVPTDIFASWNRKAEEKTPVSEMELLKCFEELASQAIARTELVAPARASGEQVQVRKAAVGGCAVITFKTAEMRDAILKLGKEFCLESGVTVKVNPQVDPKTKEEIPTDMFAAWGRKVEDKTPVSETSLLHCFEKLCLQVSPSVTPVVENGDGLLEVPTNDSSLPIGIS